MYLRLGSGAVCRVYADADGVTEVVSNLVPEWLLLLVRTRECNIADHPFRPSHWCCVLPDGWRLLVFVHWPFLSTNQRAFLYLVLLKPLYIQKSKQTNPSILDIYESACTNWRVEPAYHGALSPCLSYRNLSFIFLVILFHTIFSLFLLV